VFATARIKATIIAIPGNSFFANAKNRDSRRFLRFLRFFFHKKEKKSPEKRYLAMKISQEIAILVIKRPSFSSRL
jgi:hypothetical protein